MQERIVRILTAIFIVSFLMSPAMGAATAAQPTAAQSAPVQLPQAAPAAEQTAPPASTEQVPSSQPDLAPQPGPAELPAEQQQTAAPSVVPTALPSQAVQLPQAAPWRLVGVAVYETAPAIAVWRADVTLPAGQTVLTLGSLPLSVDMDSIGVAVTAGDCTLMSVLPSPGAVSMRLSMPTAGAASLEVCYAFEGLNWSASYTAWLEPGRDQATVDGWRSIRNSTGAALPPTLLYLVAGADNTLGTRPGFRGASQLGATSMAVPLTSTLDDGASIKMPIARLSALPAKFVYVFDTIPVSSLDALGLGAPERVPASLGLEFTLPADDDRVSYPLQAGTLHVYSRVPDGTAFSLGTSTFAAVTGPGPVLTLLDRTPAVRAEKYRTDQKRIGTGTVEEAYQVKLTNTGATAADVIVMEAFPGDWTVLQSTPVGSTRSASRMAQFALTVPAGGRLELLYRVRYTY